MAVDRMKYWIKTRIKDEDRHTVHQLLGKSLGNDMDGLSYIEHLTDYVCHISEMWGYCTNE